jgi:hypothetical protein
MDAERPPCEHGSCKRGLGSCPPCLFIWAAFGGYLLLSWLFP